jgi:hypothetical protein
MKRITLTFAIIAVAMLVSLAPMQPAERLHAQDPDTVTYRCTTHEVGVRACTQWNCEVLYLYSPDTLVFVTGTETGDREAGSDEWLRVEDPVLHQDGYIHSQYTRTCEPENWQIAPVIPEISAAAREIYQRGLEQGNDPAAFSKVGDCQNVVNYYLGMFDTPMQYDLGPYIELQTTIDQFGGSWSRISAAVEAGFTVASVLSPLWADPEMCESGETPLECEERLHNPSIAIISMETWNRETQQPTSVYEDYLSKTVEFWIERGVVPIVATKADNIEGDNSINAAIARVAETYDIPLWNFWLAAQSLPNHGLADHFHLRWARSFYNNPERLRDGWPVRNLTALQVINAVWQAAVPDEL